MAELDRRDRGLGELLVGVCQRAVDVGDHQALSFAHPDRMPVASVALHQRVGARWIGRAHALILRLAAVPSCTADQPASIS